MSAQLWPGGFSADNGVLYRLDMALGVDDHPPSHAARVIILLFVVVIVIALALVGYWLYRRRQLQQQSDIRLLD